MSTTSPSRLCFVVGPIGEKGSPGRQRADILLRYVIMPAMADFPDFSVVRADQIGTPGMIDGQIITRLRDADLVIADLATSNPNAFYEIGIRHMVSKPIVHMRQLEEKIPFDVTLFSAVTYDLGSIEGHDAVVADLKRHVGAAIDPKHDVDNPVTRTLGRQSFDQKALPDLALLRAELDSLRASVKPLIDANTVHARRARIAAALSKVPEEPSAQRDVALKLSEINSEDLLSWLRLARSLGDEPKDTSS
jgi:hypothetical protein